MKILTIDGKDYTLKYTFNSMCEMEEKTSKSLTTFESMTFSTVRAFLWAGLLELNHSISIAQAGKLVESWCAENNKSFMDLGNLLIEAAMESGFFGEALTMGNLNQSTNTTEKA